MAGKQMNVYVCPVMETFLANCITFYQEVIKLKAWVRFPTAYNQQKGGAMLMTPTLCLALVMYWEARNQPLDGMVAVGQVVMEHTVKDQPCKTLHIKGLFSWAKKGIEIPNPKYPADVAVFEKQLFISKKMLLEHLRCKRLKGKYTFFNDYKIGRRFKTNVALVRIGDLVFYQENFMYAY